MDAPMDYLRIPDYATERTVDQLRSDLLIWADKFSGATEIRGFELCAKLGPPDAFKDEVESARKELRALVKYDLGAWIVMNQPDWANEWADSLKKSLDGEDEEDGYAPAQPSSGGYPSAAAPAKAPAAAKPKAAKAAEPSAPAAKAAPKAEPAKAKCAKAKAPAAAAAPPAKDAFPDLGATSSKSKDESFPTLGGKPKASGAKAGSKAKAKAQPAAVPEPAKVEPEEDDDPWAMPAPMVEEDLSASIPETAEDLRPCINLVCVGHVDAGKSTLMGHLLCLVGNVSSKQLHKFEKDAKQIGKASFAFAWVLDEGEDERQRGVTIDVCVKHFETESRRFTILDAPGHRDFVPNMLQGAVQADVALMVADVSHFEAGFDRGGQTKEHLQLVRSLGLTQMIVCINKLDTCGWDKKVFETIKGRLHAYIIGPECGFKDENVHYVPLSGFSGENMLERKDPKLSWWDGPTLIQALDQLNPPPRPPADGPLRICISDVYRSGASCCVSGKVEAGTVSVGQKVLLLPSGEHTTVKSLQTRSAPARRGRPGDYMDAVMLPVEQQFANIGGVICDPKRPVQCVEYLRAQILVFDLEIPMMRGQELMCYLHTETLTATLVRLEQLLIKGKPQDKRPKCLQKGNIAVVQLKVNRKVCVEPKPEGGTATSLSRLVLRDRGRTVAAGVVLAAH